MPKMTGMAAAKKILDADKNVKIIFLTAFHNDEHIFKAVNIGASGLISKEAMKGELISAIRAVAKGENYFSGKSSEEIISIMNRFNEKSFDSTADKLNLLSEREREILIYIAQGLTSDEIAKIISVGKRIIDNSRSEILQKLNLKSLPQLIKFAVEFSYNEKGKSN
jgi:two-component system response regulator NreC